MRMRPMAVPVVMLCNNRCTAWARLQSGRTGCTGRITVTRRQCCGLFRLATARSFARLMTAAAAHVCAYVTVRLGACRWFRKRWRSKGKCAHWHFVLEDVFHHFVELFESFALFFVLHSFFGNQRRRNGTLRLQLGLRLLLLLLGTVRIRRWTTQIAGFCCRCYRAWTGRDVTNWNEIEENHLAKNQTHTHTCTQWPMI